MRNKLLIIMGPLLLWACSGDPNKKDLLGQNPASQSQQAADSISGNEGIVDNENPGQVAANGSVVEVPVEEVKPETKPNQTQSKDPAVAQGPEAKPAEGEDENSVTPPHKVTGAFLVGEVIADETTGAVQIGIVAKKDDVRLSEQPERFDLKWNLQADESLGSSLRLVATKNPAYDRVLQFDGSLEELEKLGGEIAIHLMVSEIQGDTKLEDTVKTTFTDLMNPAGEDE